MSYQRRDFPPLRRQILGARLKAERKARKLTLEDVETRTGVASAQLNRYENGDVTPSLPTLLPLAAFYDMPLDQLLAGIDGFYDKVISQRLPLDAQKIARAMVDAALVHATETLEDALRPAPTEERPISGSRTSPGTTARVRARRAPKKT